jgi:drug/metabolite transporter (DMT)-like permease
MPTRSSARRAWLADAPVLMVAVVWGSSYLATKEITSNSTVIAMLLLRFLVAIPLLGIAARRRIRRLTPRELRGGLILGLILTTIFLLETYGVVHTSASGVKIMVRLMISPALVAEVWTTP